MSFLVPGHCPNPLLSLPLPPLSSTSASFPPKQPRQQYPSQGNHHIAPSHHPLFLVSPSYSFSLLVAVDDLMPLNLEPSSSQFSVPEYDPPPSSARVGWSHSNPESLLLKQQLKDGPVQPHPDPFLSSRVSVSTNHLPPLVHINPLPSNHPAKAKRFAPPQEDSPSLPQHIDDFHSAIDKMNHKVHRNAKHKAHKSRRDSTRPDPDSSSKSITNQSLIPLRREHSFQGASSAPPHKPSRLQARASEPNILALRPDEVHRTSSPPFGSSRNIPHSILDTLRKPMDIDWDNVPSNTPTPPCRRHKNRSSLDSGSFNDRNDVEASSSSPSPLSLAVQQCSRAPLNSLGDDVSMIDEDARASLIQPRNSSSSASDEALSNPGQPSAEVPSPPILMPPPPRPSGHLTQQTPPPAPTPSLLSRPYAPPSQARPTQTQGARPRASQRPRPLGMCRGAGQSSTSGGVNKPYKLPLPTRPKRSPPAPAPYRPARYVEAPVESTPLLPEGSGDSELESGRRSMSPIVPDPPHIVARAQMLASQPPVLQMSARRPEPRGDEDEEVKDADSSADLWACFD